MSNKNILFICNTVFQCITAITLKYKQFDQDEVDIIISDHMNDSYNLYNRMKSINLFREVYYVKSKGYSYYKEKIPKTFFEKLREEAFPRLEMFHISKRYDILMVYNVDRFAQALFSILAKKNKSIEVRLFDEGFSTYTNLYKEQINFISNMSKKKKALRFFTKRKYIYECITGLYLFEPKLLCWDCPCPVFKILKADKQDIKYKKLLNKAFGYDEIQDKYDKKVIFFEESYANDNIDVGDVELVENIAQIVGKENIYIKIHPRNPVNRFKELGYDTNENTGIPWEIIALNNDFSDKTFITVSSSAVLTPRILLGQNTKTFLLYNCLIKKSPYIDESTLDYFERFTELFGDSLYILEDSEQMNTINKIQYR